MVSYSIFSYCRCYTVISRDVPPLAQFQYKSASSNCSVLMELREKKERSGYVLCVCAKRAFQGSVRFRNCKEQQGQKQRCKTEMENPSKKLMRHERPERRWLLLLRLPWPAVHKHIVWTGTRFLTELQMGAQNIHFELEKKCEVVMLRVPGRSRQNLVVLMLSSNFYVPDIRTLSLILLKRPQQLNCTSILFTNVIITKLKMQ